MNVEALLEREQVHLLTTVIETGSFSAAADKLGVTKSSISQQIKRLEGLAGLSLFRRNRRGVEPTSECEIVIKYAMAMKAIAEDFKSHFGVTGNTRKICVGMGEDFCRTALPSFLGLLSAGLPRVELRVLAGSYDMLAEAIDNRAADLVVMRQWDRYPDARKLWRDEQVWYGHPRFASAVMDPVPLVVPISPNPLRPAILDLLRANGRTWRIRFEGVGLAGIEAALQSGLGLCIGPRSMPMCGVKEIGPESGLPPSPAADFVMAGPWDPADSVVQAVAELLQRLADGGFRTGGASSGEHRSDV
ncbi:DNA-binding transcriptional LysR family regulator [Methylobacterium sp. OAE515]|uniref:LysR family transcriptional regulator n=1 Tax=Methylobacterium sp. OAE515 TaxID=2817895 RepID=UPI00178BA5CD